MTELKIQVINNQVPDDVEEYLERTSFDVKLSDYCVNKLHQMSKSSKEKGDIDFEILDPPEYFIPETHYNLEFITTIGEPAVKRVIYKLQNVDVRYNTNTSYKVGINGSVKEEIA